MVDAHGPVLAVVYLISVSLLLGKPQSRGHFSTRETGIIVWLCVQEEEMVVGCFCHTHSSLLLISVTAKTQFLILGSILRKLWLSERRSSWAISWFFLQETRPDFSQ